MNCSGSTTKKKLVYTPLKSSSECELENRKLSSSLPIICALGGRLAGLSFRLALHFFHWLRQTHTQLLVVFTFFVINHFDDIFTVSLICGHIISHKQNQRLIGSVREWKLKQWLNETCNQETAINKTIWNTYVHTYGFRNILSLKYNYGT